MTADPGGRRLIAGRYQIKGLLGKGGMSEVHYGHDERLDRPVAIKLLRPPSYVPVAPDSPEAVEILDALERDQKRFLREIRVTAQLELPGVPAVYDTGVDDLADGTRRLWVVMQLLHGSTLETLIDGASFDGPDMPGMAWAAAVAAQAAPERRPAVVVLLGRLLKRVRERLPGGSRERQRSASAVLSVADQDRVACVADLDAITAAGPGVRSHPP
jgi:hypothetical protein